MSEVHLSFDEVRAGAHELAKKRREALGDYERHAGLAVEAEREFRKQKAIRLAVHRKEEKGFGESEVLADGDVADLRAKRDMENALARSALLLIESLEREQSTLRQLADFSKELEAVG